MAGTSLFGVTLRNFILAVNESGPPGHLTAASDLTLIIYRRKQRRSSLFPDSASTLLIFIYDRAGKGEGRLGARQVHGGAVT